MGKIVAVLGGYLLAGVKGLADFFLSGGAVVFTAIASFVGLFLSLYTLLQGFAERITPFLDENIQFLSWLQNISTENSFATMLKYCCAVDCLYTTCLSVAGVVSSVFVFIFFGIISTFVGILFPLLIFKVVFFIRKNVWKVN